MVNFRKIKARMLEMGITQKDIADTVWKCKTPTVSQKLNGVRPVSLDEADKLGQILKLSDREYYMYFFASEIA